MPEFKLTPEQISEIAVAIQDRSPFTESGIHINYGDAEDRYAAFNRGHDDADNGKPCDPERDAPTDEPFRQSWIKGYTEGWQFVMLQQVPWIPNLPEIARYLAEHPETVEALTKTIDMANRDIELALDDDISTAGEARIARNRVAVVSGLLRAMRGEAG